MDIDETARTMRARGIYEAPTLSWIEFQSSLVMRGCEVCYRAWTDDVIIAVNDIPYERGKRITPWYLCPECAEKIIEAVTTKKAENDGNAVVEDRQ